MRFMDESASAESDRVVAGPAGSTPSLDVLLSPEQREAIRAWCVKYGVALCYLFGSRCQGYADAFSDWDVGILFHRRRRPRNRMRRWFDMDRDLRQIFPGDEVDLVFLEDATPAIRNAASHGVLLYAASERLRADFVERTWRIWWDLRPFLDAQDREMMEAMADEFRRR